MSSRAKKSTSEAFRDRTSNGVDAGKTPMILRNMKLVNSDKTPAKTGLPDEFRKKQRSSLKKIKKFLGSHSKKKRMSESSPMVSQLKSKESMRKKHDSAKKSPKSMTNADLPKQRLSVLTTSSSSFPSLSSKQSKTNLRHVTSDLTAKCEQNGGTSVTLQRPPSSSKIRASDSETDLVPAKRLRLNLSSNSNSPHKEQELPAAPEDLRRSLVVNSPEANNVEKKTLDLAWWNPSKNSYHSSSVSHDSNQEAAKLFESLIQPVTTSKFFKELWEKKPLLVRRHNTDYNDGWFSTAELDQILRHEKIMFGENIDVVTYLNGKRETHNLSGRAFAAVVWDFYQQGCSVRLLNPQTYSKNVWKMLSMLQEYFGCMAGANIYLTPAGTQGFAPHYDDIEAFILQLEGRKRWRVYEPRDESEVLPRISSPNYTEDDLPPPVLDATLEPGDLLYFPRGYIHQGNTMEDVHSLHMTVSVGQKNTWGDLFEKLVPRALEVAMEEDVDFRRSLPHDYLSYMGVAFSDEKSPERQRFLHTVEQLMRKMLSYAPVDAACDQMAKKVLEDGLPPFLSEAEEQRTVRGSGEKWDAQNQMVTGAAELDPDTEIKIIRRGCLRLVTEEKVCVYHNLENARVYHGAQSLCIEVEPDEAEAVEFLLKSYPDYVPVESLPLENLTKQMELANTLYSRGLLMTREPLEPIEGEDDSSECDE